MGASRVPELEGSYQASHSMSGEGASRIRQYHPIVSLCHSSAREEILGNIGCWHLWVKNFSKQGWFVFKKEVHILNSPSCKEYEEASLRKNMRRPLLAAPYTANKLVFHITHQSFTPNYPPPAEIIWALKDK